MLLSKQKIKTVERGFKTHFVIEFTDAIPYWLITIHSYRAKETFELLIDGALPKRGAKAMAHLLMMQGGHGLLRIKSAKLHHTPFWGEEE